METEKIKTAEEFLKEKSDWFDKSPGGEKLYFESEVIRMMKEYASQFKQKEQKVLASDLDEKIKALAFRFYDPNVSKSNEVYNERLCDHIKDLFKEFKQPPVSVMPGDEDINKIYSKWCASIQCEGKVGFNGAVKALLSLSKEAPKEQEAGNYFCKEWNNVGFVCEEQCDQCKKTEKL